MKHFHLSSLWWQRNTVEGIAQRYQKEKEGHLPSPFISKEQNCVIIIPKVWKADELEQTETFLSSGRAKSPQGWMFCIIFNTAEQISRGTKTAPLQVSPGLYHAEKGTPSFQAEKFRAFTWQQGETEGKHGPFTMQRKMQKTIRWKALRKLYLKISESGHF